MNTTFDFRLMHPDGQVGQQILSIWSASVSVVGDPVTKPLFSDGCSGVFLVLKGTAKFNDHIFTRGAYWTPVKRQAESIELSPDSLLMGFRFQPATQLSALTPIHQQLSLGESLTMNTTDALPIALDHLIEQLIAQLNIEGKFERLNIWLSENLMVAEPSSKALSQAIAAIDPTTELQTLETLIPLSLRQIERRFKSQVGMTPKLYQRLIRVKATIDLIKRNPAINLSDLAVECGYSDQAHMTREFRKLAKMTPGQYQQEKR